MCPNLCPNATWSYFASSRASATPRGDLDGGLVGITAAMGGVSAHRYGCRMSNLIPPTIDAPGADLPIAQSVYDLFSDFGNGELEIDVATRATAAAVFFAVRDLEKMVYLLGDHVGAQFTVGNFDDDVKRLLDD